MNIQVHDAGIVTGLLKNRPFLLGEIFIQDTTKNLNANNYLRDKLTGAPIMRLQEGDLYGGCNEWYGGLSGTAADATVNGITKSVHPHIYQLGSGSALKFANHLLYKFADSDNNILNEVYTELSNNPNTLYLYVGPKGASDPIKSAFANSEIADTKLFQKLERVEEGVAKQKFEVIGDAGNTHHLGDDPKYQNLANRIDSGDLVFYSAVYKQVFIWHLSRSQASLVRFHYNELESKSLNKEFKTELNEGTYSLKSFLDKVGRQFQRLTDEGWIEAEATKSTTDGTIYANIPDTIKEGNVVHIPFLVGNAYINPEDELTVKYPTLDELDVASSADKVLPGDLLFAVPSTDGKFKLVKVSLLSEFLKRMSLKDFNTLRADQYAKDRWESDEAATNYESKDEKFIDDIQKGVKKLPDLLNRFGATKADIDPKTGKIITSQIPSFILGGLKRVNTFTLELLEEAKETTTAPKEGIDVTKKGEVLAALLTDDWEFDNDGNITYTGAEDFDRQTLDNIYFIWKDDPFEITDDYAVFFEKKQADDIDDPNSKKVKEINNGDMLIYNGDLKKFEVIDNSSELISLIVDNKHVVGTPTLTPKTSDRNSTFKVIDGTDFADKTIFTNEVEEVSIDVSNPDSGNIVFGNPYGVITAVTEVNETLKVLVDHHHLPIINSKGVAYNSLFSFLQNADEDGHDSGLKLELQDRGLQFINTNFDYSPINRDDNFRWIFEDEIAKDPDFNPNTLKLDYDDLKGAIGHLYLPNVTGTLATEEEILSATKFLLDAIKEALDTYALSGTDDYLQTVHTKNGKKYLKDSAISFDSNKAGDGTPADASIAFHPGDEKGTNAHSSTPKPNEILVQATNENIGGTDVEWHQDITVRNKIPEIPTEQLSLGATKVQNILPNFDGTLLNTNSIIFCGYWTDPDPENS